MIDPKFQPVYFCDFLTPDGIPMASYKSVRFTAGKPSYFVVVNGRGFKKMFESGYPANRVIYIEVSMENLTNEVFFDGD